MRGGGVVAGGVEKLEAAADCSCLRAEVYRGHREQHHGACCIPIMQLTRPCQTQDGFGRTEGASAQRLQVPARVPHAVVRPYRPVSHGHLH